MIINFLKIIILLFIINENLFSLTNTNIILNENNNGNHPIQSFQYFIDTSDLLTIKDIEKKTFYKTIKNGYGLGKIEGKFWIKLVIKNETQNSHFILSTNEPYYNIANLYSYKNGNWKIITTSSLLSLKNRNVPSSIVALKFDLEPNLTNTFYLQLSTKTNYFGKLQIYDYDNFLIYNKTGIQSFFPFFFGFLIIAGFANAFLYFAFKEKINLYYAGFNLMMILFYAKTAGILVYLGLEKIQTHLFFSSGMLIVFLILFTRELFNLKQMYPSLCKYAKLMVYWFFILSVIMMFKQTPWNNILNPSIVILNLLFIAFGIFLVLQKNKIAPYYLIGLNMSLFGLTLFLLMEMGQLEYNTLTRYGSFFGAFIEAIMFQILLMYRFTLLREQEHRVNQERKTYAEHLRFVSIGKSIGGIVHQWKIPMIHFGNIVTLLEATLKHNEKDTLPLLKKEIPRLKENIQLMQDTSTNLLKHFMETNEKIEFNPKEVIKNNIIPILSTKLKLKNVDININSDYEFKINTEKNIFINLLIILLDNAIDAFEKDTNENHIHISIHNNKLEYLIIIQDNAGGITIKPIEQIFEYNVSEKEDGNGIGLGIVKTLVNERLEGTICVRNINNGAEFIISIPKKEKKY